MDNQLRQLTEEHYSQKEFLHTLQELALTERWFDIQHLVQHDMVKAVLADYSYLIGKDYLNNQIFYTHWEEVIEIGWQIFCEHTHISREQVRLKLTHLHEII